MPERPVSSTKPRSGVGLDESLGDRDVSGAGDQRPTPAPSLTEELTAGTPMAQHYRSAATPGYRGDEGSAHVE
jgi:hypothetical protein